MSDLYVICKVAGSEYAAPGDLVYQMETYSAATPVPGTPSFLVGLVQIRQQIIPVIDIRVRFSLEMIPPTLESRVIVLKIGERLIGILVDSAREVRNIPADQFRAPPEVLAKQSAGFVKSVTHLKDRIIMLLDPDKVVGGEADKATRGEADKATREEATNV